VPRQVRSAVDAALVLLAEHRATLSALTVRSPADFRPLPALWSRMGERLAAAFDEVDGLPPSLVGELAPLLSPRLERIVSNLRRRVGRTRRDLPLARIREMDPACLRRNSRRPGRTLLEKAGPRGRLRAVLRVERFDTTENRVLRAAARVLGEQATGIVAAALSDEARSSAAARELRRLARGCTNLLDRPELADLGPPRPGERPSNALLGDADYRAAWRAWKLLRRDSIRFVDEWRRLDQVALELALAAAWVVVDEAGLEALPGWTRILPDATGSGRIESSASRAWIAWNAEGAAVVTVEPRFASGELQVGVIQVDPAGKRIERNESWRVKLGPGEPSETPELIVPLAPEGPAPSRLVVREQVAALLEPVLPQLQSVASDVHGPALAAQVGLSLLGGRVHRASGGQVEDLGPAAAAELEAPGEAPLLVLGRAATWCPDVAGPSALAGDRAPLSARAVGRLGGLHETALVVPDGADERTLARVRPLGRRTWTVWAPVAAALAAAWRHDEVVPRPAVDSTVAVLVSVVTEATCEIARLELRGVEHDGEIERLWIRLPMTGVASPGLEDLAELMPDALGSWLREGWGRPGWDLAPEPVLRPAVEAPSAQLARLPMFPGSEVPPVVARIAVGAVPEVVLSAAPDTPLVRLEVADLAVGAEVFLERRAAGLPTWVERLPRLDIQVRQGRGRVPVPLVPPRTEVAPGDEIRQEPELWFDLPLGEPRIDFPMLRDHRRDPLVIRLEGAPLPLREPVAVGVSLRFRHGLDGVEGHLIARGAAPFERIPFRLAGGGADLGPTSVDAPPPEPVELLDEGDARRVSAAIDAVLAQLKVLDHRIAKRLKRGDATAAAPLVEALDDLVRLVRPLHGPVERVAPSLSGGLGDLAERLEWLLGLRSLEGAGRAPGLDRCPSLSAAAIRARAATTVPLDRQVARKLATEIQRLRDPALVLRSLGRVTRAAEEPAWELLAGWEPKKLSECKDWARSVERVLRTVPGFAATLTAATAGALLGSAMDRLRQLAGLPPRQQVRRRADIYWVLRLVAASTRAREVGHLAPDSETVVGAIGELNRLREELTDEVRRYGEAGGLHEEDEAIDVAIDYLAGRYRALASARER